MAGPFKMKGWSPFTKKTDKGPIMPTNHPVTLHTEEEGEKSKGKLYDASKVPNRDRKFIISSLRNK
jgi:hypothetical protein